MADSFAESLSVTLCHVRTRTRCGASTEGTFLYHKTNCSLILPRKNARMSRTRSSDFPAKQAGTRIGRYFAAVLRTKMSVSRILPGKTAVPEGNPDGTSTGLYLAANENLRNVTSRAHLGSVCGEARIAFVPVRHHVSSQALRLHHHAALKQGLRTANK